MFNLWDYYLLIILNINYLKIIYFSNKILGLIIIFNHLYFK